MINWNKETLESIYNKIVRAFEHHKCLNLNDPQQENEKLRVIDFDHEYLKLYDNGKLSLYNRITTETTDLYQPIPKNLKEGVDFDKKNPFRMTDIKELKGIYKQIMNCG